MEEVVVRGGRLPDGVLEGVSSRWLSANQTTTSGGTAIAAKTGRMRSCIEILDKAWATFCDMS